MSQTKPTSKGRKPVSAKLASIRSMGMVRVATVAPRLKVADTVYNASQIIKAMQAAQKARVDVLVTPELSITAYTCADLFFQTTLVDGAMTALGRIVEASESFDGIVFVGAPIAVDDKLYNCAVAVSQGRVLGVVPKTYLPGYKEFYEPRWFAPSSVAKAREVRLFGAAVPFGTDQLFTTESLPGLVIGTEVCEDLWAVIPPSNYAALQGANLIVNLSASNELVGKGEYRSDLVVGQSGRLMAGYVYVSSGVDESTTDVVFGGHALITENGSLIAEGERFSRKAELTIGDIDIEKLRMERIVNNSYGECQRNTFGSGSADYRRSSFRLGKERAASEIGLKRFIDGLPFVPKNVAKLAARCEEIFSIQVNALVKRLERIGSKQVTIGVSGGLDSTLALLVTVKAFDLLGWDRKGIKGYTLPGFGTTSRTKGNALALMEHLGITSLEVNIREMCMAQMREEGHAPFGIDLDALYVEAEAEYLAAVRALVSGAPAESANQIMVRKFTERLVAMQAGGTELKDLHFENVQARARTKILMDNGFVIGTGDLSELVIGWCTYNGDHMAMYGVNASIPKTLVKFLVQWAAENQFEGATRTTLIDICNTEISPELLPTDKDGKIVQKTESVVGPYELTDFFLYHMLRNGFRPEKILFLAEHAQFEGNYSVAELRKWLRLFIGRFFASQFKRSCLPDAPKVGSVSVSPRGDLRMPSDAEPTIWLEWAQIDIAELHTNTAFGAATTPVPATSSTRG